MLGMSAESIENFSIDESDFLFITESSHSQTFRMRFHRHDFYELSFILDGKGVYEILPSTHEYFCLPVQENYMLLWNGKVPHRAIDEPSIPLRQMILIFDETYLRRFSGKAVIDERLSFMNPLVIRNPMYTMKLKALVREILIEKRQKNILYEDVVFSHLSSILSTMIRVAEGTEKISEESRDARIKKAIQYIHDNYFRSLSLQEIASYSFLSVRHFTELFKKYTGQSFIQYFHAYRIEKAKAALRETDKSITDIAFEVGYDDSAHFIQRFRKIENMTPSRYRRSSHHL
jgi:AraC-like DNA-binding protein